MILRVIRKHTLCKLGLHLVATVIEQRLRYKYKSVRGLRFKIGSQGHYVQGYYKQCICCGKKFSNFKRIRNYEKSNNMC